MHDNAQAAASFRKLIGSKTAGELWQAIIDVAVATVGDEEMMPETILPMVERVTELVDPITAEVLRSLCRDGP